jgi:hypothetical protein
MARTCKHSNEPWSSIKDENILTTLEKLRLFKIILLREVYLIFNPQNHSLYGRCLWKLM